MQAHDIITRSQLAGMLKVRTNSLRNMMSDGTIPQPINPGERYLLWERQVIEDWFKHLQPEQSAYVPVNGIGLPFIETMGVYVCPVVDGTTTFSKHISNRRPSHLVLYVDNSVALVYEVEYAITEQGVCGETLIIPKGAKTPTHVMQDMEMVKGLLGIETPAILFKLGKQLGHILVRDAVRRGGTISTDKVMDALKDNYIDTLSSK